MKYAQLIIGLLAGTALGGSVVAGTATTGGTASTDSESIKKIVRQVISEEPKLILESVQRFQTEEHTKSLASASESLKDKEVQDQLYNNPDLASLGPRDSKRTVVEFFDYNCGVCKMQFKSIDAVVKKDSSVRVIFVEFPIFGATSDRNSHIGIAVHRLYPEKYYDFHSKMMTATGRGTEPEAALKMITELGMDAEKIDTESKTPEVDAILAKNRQLGEKLNVRGTPLLIVGDEIIPHAIQQDELEAKLAGAKTGEDAGAQAPAEPEEKPE